MSIKWKMKINFFIFLFIASYMISAKAPIAQFITDLFTLRGLV